MTVCPPAGSNTALNYDLTSAQYKTLDEATRDDLVLEASELLHEHDHEEYKKFVSDMLDDKEIALMYAGYRRVTLLHKSSFREDWNVWMSGGQGSCSSPGFGKEKTEQNFIEKISFRCKVALPDVSDKVLHINTTLDTNIHESVNIISWSNQTIIPNKERIPN